MESSSLILALILPALALAFFSRTIKTQKKNQPPKLPPGPKPWPIIGNLNLLGPIPHQSLHHLSQIYGEIMLLKFGKFPVIIASSPKMAQQFLKVHDASFASRPPLAAGKHISYDNSEVAFAPYGPYWQKARKIYMSELLSPKKLESSEQIRVEERRKFLSRLRALAREPVVLKDHLSRYTLSTICRMVVTDKYYRESGEERSSSIVDMHVLQEMMNEWFLLSGAFNVGDWIPWLDFFNFQGYIKRMKALCEKSDKFYGYVIDDHLARRGEGGEKYAKEDFVDVLLQMAEDPNGEVELTRDCVKALTMNVLLGGTDSSTTTIQWTIHEGLRKPRIIEKAKEELERVIGRDRWVEENDFTRLPYIDAIIMETLRLHPNATLLAPHYAIQDCSVEGYDISKGTTIFINAWSIGRDPNSWDAAEEFLPERFMGKEIDMAGSDFTLLPFGSGRRRCPGYNLGLKIVRTTLASLLHGFELKLEEGMRGEDICMEEEYGLTTNPKCPISIILEPTLPPHLY